MQISIKPICDWPIYLTAYAEERPACLKQTSFHSTTSRNSFAVIMNLNVIQGTETIQYEVHQDDEFYLWCGVGQL